MALAPESFSFGNITLKYRSFTHPKTGEVWFTANDVAKSLGYKNPTKAIYKHVTNSNFKSKWNDLIAELSLVEVPSNWQNSTMMINEVGIYRLILSSRLKAAIPFRDWVCGTVLPSIRKTGRFFMGDVHFANELLESNRALIESIEQLENERRDGVALSHRIADMAQFQNPPTATRSPLLTANVDLRQNL